MQGAPGQPGQQQVIIVQGTQQTNLRTEPRIYTNYLSGQSLVLGSIQICLGILAVIVNCVGFHYDGLDHVPENISHSAVGFWGGGFYILVGAFGIHAAKKKTMCPIVTFMVLSIVSAAVINFAVIGVSAAGVGIADDPYNHGCWGSYPYEYGYSCQRNTGLLAVMAILLTISLIEIIICIWSSIICCMAVCCGRRTPQTTIHYAGQTQQGQVVVINGQTVTTGTTYPQQGQVMVTNPAAYPTQPAYPQNAAPPYQYPAQPAPPQGYPQQAPPHGYPQQAPPQGYPQQAPVYPQQGQTPAAPVNPPAYNASAPPPPVYTENVDVSIKKE